MSDMQPQPLSPFRISMRRFLRNRLAVACVVLVGIFIAACLVGPWISPHPYAGELRFGEENQGPSARYWFGTDSQGRDLLVRCLVGGRISIAVGLIGTLISGIIGVAYGAIAGYRGGFIDSLMMRFVDVLFGLPYLLFVVLIMVMLGTHISSAQRIIAMFVALGAVQWLAMARIIRGEVIALREREFVEAARACGARSFRIIFRHIVPNLVGIIIVYSTLTIPMIMLQEAFLSFLGLGVQPPLPSWGSLIRDGANLMMFHPRLVILPGLMFTLILFALNFIGDGLRDAFDPQMRE